MKLYRCCNCGHSCPERDLMDTFPDIPGLLDRIAPGERVPMGTCPKCLSLCHEVQSPSDQVDPPSFGEPDHTGPAELTVLYTNPES